MTVILAFIVIGFILYGACLRGTILLDDVTIFSMQKPYMVMGDWRKAWRAPWRRLTMLTYALNGKLSGWDTYSYHIVNVSIHIANALLTVLIFRALGFSDPWTVVGGFIFLVHPLAAAAVGYISGRPSLLSALFVFSAILAVLHGWPVLVFPLLLGAVLSKEDAVASILLLAALERSWWAVAFLAILPLGYLVQRKKLYGIWSKANRLGQPTYSITAITHYLSRLPGWFIGEGLNNKHAIEPVRGWYYDSRATRLRLVAALGLAGVIVSGAIGASGQLVTGLAMVLLSPMLIYMVLPIEDPIMDYRGYVGLLGMVVMMLAVLEKYSIVLGIAFAVYSFCRAFPRVLRFRNPITFWVGCMKDGSSENGFVVAQLGMSFHLMADLKSAEHYYRKALDLDPSHSMAWNNLALIYSTQNKVPECVDTLKAWTVACPKQRKSWEKLRLAYEQLKDETNRDRCDQMLAVL